MSKNKITGKVLVVQLGRRESQIILVGNDSEILHGVTVPTPEGAVEDGAIRNADAVRDMLKAALKAPEFKRVRQVVFSLCTTQVITETVTAPDMPAAKLEKLLRANMDMYFPVDTQDYHLVWQVIGPKNRDDSVKELAVQLWAVPIALLRRYYAVGNDCGLSVAAIDYCGHSAATVVGASFARPGKNAKSRKKPDLNQPITFGRKKNEAEAADAPDAAAETRRAQDTDLHILLERDLLGMTFVQNGQVMLQRFIRCGDNPAYQFGELAMMLEYFRALDIGRGSSIRGIVSGSFAADAEMVEDLTDALGISFTRLAVPYAIQWALCVGAAHTDLEFGVPTFNAAGKSRSDIQGQLWQYALVLAGGLAVLGVIMFTLSARLVWDSEISTLQNEQNMLITQAAQYNGFADNYKEYQSMYESYSSDWDTVFNSLYTHNDNLVLVMQELEGILPEDSSVTNMQIMANGLNVSFACEDKEEAAYLIMALRDMQYADLMAISNLEGGGVGAATSYGSDDSEEAPPEEGSSDLMSESDLMADMQALSEVAANSDRMSVLNQEVLFDAALDMTPEQFDVLWKAYGYQPEAPKNAEGEMVDDPENTLAALKAAGVEKDDRDTALEELLNTNPFAINWFKELLIEDFNSGSDSILFNHIVLDLVKLGVLTNGLPDNFAEAQELVDNLVAALTDDAHPEKLEATEALMCTNRDMELAYLYHLKLAMLRDDSKTEEENEANMPKPFYYLDLEKIAKDVINGVLETGDEKLDKLLDDLLPYLGGLIPGEPTEPTDPTDPTDPVAPTDPADPTDPVNPTEPTAPTDPADPTDPTDPTEPTEPEEDITESIGKYIKEYFTKGQSSNKEAHEQIENYLNNGGKSGDDELDKKINAYIANGNIDAELQVYLEARLKGYLTGVDAIDNIIGKFINNNGDTGISVLNQRLTVALQKIANSSNSSSNSQSGSGGGGGSGAAAPTDTRIHFTVILNYNDELRQEELARKGLSYSDKIEPLEVEE